MKSVSISLYSPLILLARTVDKDNETMSVSRHIFSFTRPLARYASSTSGPSTKYSAVTHPDNVSPTPPELAAELEKAQKYTLPVYARPPLVLVRGKKSKVWDSLGRQYLDFMGGVAVNALGHADEGVIKVCICFHI